MPLKETLLVNERAALEKLERLRESIERHRTRRRELGAESGGFVGSFSTSPETPASAPAVLVAPVAGESGVPVPDAVLSPDPTAVAAPRLPATSESRGSAFALVSGALILLVIGALVTWSLRRKPDVSSPAPVVSPTPAVAPPKTTTVDPAGLLPPPVSEILTTRTVWLRVVVDGERQVERALPADSRIPLKAGTIIVVRTGDAGAVRLSLGGIDQGTLGRDGQVVTRTITVPSRASRR